MITLTVVKKTTDNISFTKRRFHKESIVFVETPLFSSGSIVTSKDGKIFDVFEPPETIFRMMIK